MTDKLGVCPECGERCDLLTHYSEDCIAQLRATCLTVDAGALNIGGTSTFTTAPRICGVCRESIPNSPMEFRTAHDACLQCPECQSDFVVWKTTSPAILRCLNCLHRWEGKP